MSGERHRLGLGPRAVLAVAFWLAPPCFAVPPALNPGPPHLITGGFLRPFGVALDEAKGRLLVADTAHHRFKWVAVKDVLSGSYTFAEHGYVSDRNAPTALTDPQAIAADAAGNVYVVNTLGGEVQLYRWSNGAYAIDVGFCKNNPHTVAGTGINLPRDIAVGSSGKVYLLDSANARILVADGPNDTDWSVHHSDATWSNPYGLAVDAAGAIYVADTSNHRIVKIAGSTTKTIGGYGSERGRFRFPRDVAVDQHGRIFVADTFNHRISVLAADGSHLANLGQAPAVGMLEKVTIDKQGRIFAVDSDLNRVVAFLGKRAAPYDVYLRDYVGDPGDDPSKKTYALSSPDILIRHAPDVDLAEAETKGLESFGFQPPRFDRLNYVYVALHNRGDQPAPDSVAQLYWYDPGSSQKLPDDLKTAGFFDAYSDAVHNTPGHVLAIPLVAAKKAVVAGPLLWRPPAPNSTKAGDGKLRLGVRVVSPHDYPPVGSAKLPAMARESNNVAERPVQVLRAPFTVGEQDTLVVRVHYPDVAGATDAATVRRRAGAAAAWISETSWKQASVTVLHRGPVVLQKNKSHYQNPTSSLVIELAQDVISDLLAVEPGLLGSGSGASSGIDRVILVTNDPGPGADRSTTGAWPFKLGGKVHYLTVSAHGAQSDQHYLSHGLSHQLGMVDLYPHEGVTFSRPYADGWDNMAKPILGQHPLVWSKQLSHWPGARDAKIFFVARPSAGSLWNNGGARIPIHFQETAKSGETIGVALGLTPGITSLIDETAFYYLEARTNQSPAAGVDSVLPSSGVLLYYANSKIPAGHGPVILRGLGGSGSGGSLANAAMSVGDTDSTPEAGIQVKVASGTGRADFDLEVKYQPPTKGYDVHLRPGKPWYMSPDIWIDNQKDGYDEAKKRKPEDRGNQAIGGEENRVYARIYNAGPSTAKNFEIGFLLAEPHSVSGGFKQYKSVFVGELKSGQSTTRWVPWTPKKGVDPHACVKVELRRLFDDSNEANNWAQKNLKVSNALKGSPYSAATFDFSATNEADHLRPIYFRADGIPESWSWSFSSEKLALAPTARGFASLTMQPPDDAPLCTLERVFVTGWTLSGDTLVPLGGTEVDVFLREATKIGVDLAFEDCADSDYGTTVTASESTTLSDSWITDWADFSWFGHSSSSSARPPVVPTPDRCLRLTATGCTDPRRPNQSIVLRYEDAQGEPVYRTVQTDANGCYEDFHVVAEGGLWSVATELVGDDCIGPASVDSEIEVPLPVWEEQFSPSLSSCAVASENLSKRIEGRLQTLGEEDSWSYGCETESDWQDLRLSLESQPDVDEGELAQTLDGEIEISRLRRLRTAVDGGALLRGRFRWHGEGASAVGRIDGLSGVAVHRSANCAGAEESDEHFELSLEGTLVSGPQAGAGITAVLALDVVTGSEGLIRGALEGTVRTLHTGHTGPEPCPGVGAVREQLVEAALAADSGPPEGPCDRLLPCLDRVASAGRGTAVLEREECVDDDCSVGRIQERRLTVALAPSEEIGASETVTSLLADGILEVDRLVETAAQANVESERGGSSQVGIFVYRGAGGEYVVGRMEGSGRDPHREPAAIRCDSGENSASDGERHYQGRLIGTVLQGPKAGSSLEARYYLRARFLDDLHQEVGMIVEGWSVTGCVGQPVADRDEVEPEVETVEVPGPLTLADLPDEHFRSLEELPPSTVEVLMEETGGELEASLVRQLRIADRRFRDLDSDGSGLLESEEFARLYEFEDGEGENGEVSPLASFELSLFDENGDGIISRDEAGEGWDGLARLDGDGDGSVTREELRALPAILAEAESQEVDREGDGEIDFLEFVRWWQELRPFSF